jgi:hypothetical protein
LQYMLRDCSPARLVSSQPHTGQYRCTNHRSVYSCSSQPVRASHPRFDFSSQQPVNIVRNVNGCAECVWHARAATRRSGDCAVPADGIQRHAVAAIVRPPRPRPHCRPRATHQRNRYVSLWHLLSRTHRSPNTASSLMFFSLLATAHLCKHDPPPPFLLPDGQMACWLQWRAQVTSQLWLSLQCTGE